MSSGRHDNGPKKFSDIFIINTRACHRDVKMFIQMVSRDEKHRREKESKTNGAKAVSLTEENLTLQSVIHETNLWSTKHTLYKSDIFYFEFLKN